MMLNTVRPREEVITGQPLMDAATLLEERSMEAEAAFLAILFSSVTPEDLTQYGAAEFADLACAAREWLEQREPYAPKIRIVPRALGVAAQPVWIVEMVDDDKPFLLESVLGELSDQGLEARLVAYPIIAVKRDVTGRLIAWSNGPDDGGWNRESFIHIHVWSGDDDNRRPEIVTALARTLSDVRCAVEDWGAMREQAEGAIAMLSANSSPLPREEIAEAIEFLQWLIDENFTFLGVRAYTLADGGDAYAPENETALGILRSPDVQVLRRGHELVSITPEVKEFLNEPKALIITKSNVRSRVHRRVHMDYIGIKRFDASGRLAGELRIVGLFTGSAYTFSPRGIPYLRVKINVALSRAGFRPDSHSGRALLNVIETYPRDELFQIDEETLYRFSLAIMHLRECPRVRVLSRLDRFDRFVSVLVFMPGDHYYSAVQAAIAEHLCRIFDGRLVALYPFFPEGALVRVHFIIARYAGETPRPNQADVEGAIAGIVMTWQDRLALELGKADESCETRRRLAQYGAGFSGSYRADYAPATAVEDIHLVDKLSPDRPLSVHFYQRSHEPKTAVRLKIWSHGRPIPLSERVPSLEHLAFKVVEESTYELRPPPEKGVQFWLHDMRLERVDGEVVDLDASQEGLETCLLMVLRGFVENDGYNALALTAGLTWREIVLLRALSRYLRQIAIPYSQDYMWGTLAKYSDLATSIVELFHARFRPDAPASAQEHAPCQPNLIAALEESLNKVASLDEDRIIRRFANVVLSAIRTNFYQVDESGIPKSTIAIKFDGSEVEGLASPRPKYEIFVYSPRLEAVHLRFGKVARGGIRWSDRPQDFRTEILGLVKAQQVKNAVIVPVGAKGGFVPKMLRADDREAMQAEGVACYRAFMSAMLDVTDDATPDGIVPPPQVVRHDEDDPYLVVAADKGTATFSNLANEIAERRGFWLGDAFASGGSAGYDHKKMGITARGAWESVKRHFREMNVDIGQTPFTVAGVGDMSGDVFGNAMLRERTIRLIAAFDHRDIFIDPDPDPETSFRERQRLFDLPRSSWRDYDSNLISRGGAVFSRSLKQIALSAEAQAVLGLAQAIITPAELMSAILKAPLDLLFFGGIGTYIRSERETNDEVGDRGNDAIRIVSRDLRCKVIGEGANLGLTQRARVAAGLRGVRLNTDAIDNSAGVNTSDLEVNLKIALSGPLQSGFIDRAERDTLLAVMTDDVARLVLHNNYQQTQALSLAQRRGFEDLGFQQRLLQYLERRGSLDRAVEFLPDDTELGERRRQGEPLTRPELAILLAYAKLSLSHDLLNSRILDDEYLSRELVRYFPPEVPRRLPDAVANHRLRREIIATSLTNSMIDRGGPTFVVRIADQTGASPDRIAAAFVVANDSYDIVALNTAIESLDNRILADVQLSLLGVVQNLLLDRVVWCLRNLDFSRGLATLVEHYRPGIAMIARTLETVLPLEARQVRGSRAFELTQSGVPDELAHRLAELPFLPAAMDSILIADRTGRSATEVAATYFATGVGLHIDRLAAAARAIPIADHFDRLALDRAVDAIGAAQRRITAGMMREGETGEAAFKTWMDARRPEVDRVLMAINEITLSSGVTVSQLTVAASMLGDLARLALADETRDPQTLF